MTDKIINIDPYDWPRCVNCNMPVEDFRVTDQGDSLVFVAVCHGKNKLVAIPDSFWQGEAGATVRLDPIDFNSEGQE